MRILLPLLLAFLFIGIKIPPAFGQALSVSLPGDKNYCGSKLIDFSATDANHSPTYTGANLSYAWYLNGVITATVKYPSITLPVGENVVTVTVSNNTGTASASQKILIEAIPGAPTVDNGGMCSGSIGTLAVFDPKADLIYRWYTTATGGSPIAYGTTFSTTTAGTYYIDATTQLGCVSSRRTQASLTASSPTGNAQTITINNTTGKEICSGTSPGTITGNAPQNMTFQWYQSTNGSDFFPISSARDKDYTPPALYQTTWYKRIAYTGFCGEESNRVKITVTPVPAAPVVNDALICQGSQATLTVSDASFSVVYRWYEVASGGTAVGTGPSFTTPVNLPPGTKDYYVDASTPATSSCVTSARTRVQVTVMTGIGNNTITASQALCTGGTPAGLTGSLPTGGGGGYMYQWQRSVDGAVFTDIAGANGQDFAPGALLTTTWYRRKVKAASTCPEVTSNTVQIAVSPLPASIDIPEPAACQGAGTTITISNPDATYTYQWYDAATGGSVLATGTSFATGPLNATKTFYVQATTAAGCTTSRRSVEVKVTPVPATPEADEVTVCTGSSATLAVNRTDASLFYRWYDRDGNLLATGTSYMTGPLAGSTTFYVEAVTNAAPGCVSPRKAIAVTVTPPITGNAITANQELCSGDTPLALTGSIPSGGGGGYTYQWQYSEDGNFFQNIAGATGINYAPAALLATTWYRRIAGANFCSPVVSNQVKVTVNQLPAAPGVPGKTICAGATATLQITSPDANLTYKWYTVAAGGIPIATNVSSYTTETLTSDKTYYVEAVAASGCTSATRQAVTVTVVPLPARPAADDATICANSRATLSVVSPDPGLQYQWYDADLGGTLLATGTSFTTTTLSGGREYYVQAVNATGCVSVSREAVAVTVLPLPEIPQVAGATICSGASTTLYVLNPDPTLIYRWYNGGTLLATGISFATGSLTASTTYEVEAATNNATACASSGTRTVIVSVIPPILNNDIAANQTICSGSSPATLTGSSPAGGSGTLTYQWEKSGDGLNFTAVSGATSPSFSPGPLATTTWYRRRVKGSDSCPPHISNAVQITVNALPATPAADGKTICSGTQTTLTVNTPAAGLTYKWYTAAIGGNILSSEPSLLTDYLSAPTTYYVEATSASGCVSSRQPVQVAVRELPGMPMAADQSICAGQNTTLSVISPGSSLAYKWYNANGALLASGHSLAVSGLQTSAIYYLEANYISDPACASPRREVKVEVTPLPSLPQVSDITICSGTKGVLQVQQADPGLTYHWYTAESGGTPIYTGPSFQTPNVLTSTRTYYVAAFTASGCGSGREAVTVNVSPLPATPMAGDVEICVGETALLAVSDADATLTYQWYGSSTASVPLATGTTYQAGPLQASTTFYLEAMTAGGCVSASRQAVQVTVTALPAVPVAEDKTICAGGSAVLAVQDPGASLLYKWYDEEGTHLATGIFYNTGPLQENKVYLLEAVTNNSNACTSPSRRTVRVTVTPAITNNTISASQTICSGSTPASLNGSVPNGGGTNYAYQWEQSTDGTNFTNITGATSQAYAPGALAATTWFRRKVSATGPCPPSWSAPVQITVVAQPAAPLADNQAICSGTTAALTINDANTNYTYHWYSTAAGGNVLDITESFRTPELTATTTFYVAAVSSSGCVSPRRAVTVNVIATPGTPQAADLFICEGQPATLAVSSAVQNLVYRWYDNTGALVGTGTSYTTPDPLFASTVYYVEAATITTPVCVSGRKAVAVSVSAVPAMPVTADATVCAGSTATLSVRIIDPAIRYKWYTTAAGGTPVAESNTFTTGVLTSGRTYYVEAVTASGCTSARASAAVIVTPLPAAPLAGDASVCAGSTASLAVTEANADLVYNWYDAGTDGNLLATGSVFTTPVLQTSRTYYLEAATANGCASAVRRAVTVQVTPLPAAPEVNNAMICAQGTVTLWVNNQTENLIYKWYDNTGGYLATGPSYTTQSLNASTAYAVEAVTTSGTACASSARRTVYVTVTPAIANNVASANQTICSGTIPAKLTGSVPNGGGGGYSYQWERSEDGVNFTAIATATNADYSPNALYVTTWFRRKVKAQGPCGESISNVVSITVNPLPATPMANNTMICAGSTATLLVKDANTAYTYRWYQEPAGGSILATGTSFTTWTLEASTTFYLEAVNGMGCRSARRALTVTVTPLPAAPEVADETICAGGQATLTVLGQSTALIYHWYNGAGDLLATGPSFTTGALNSTTVYYVEAATATTPSCVSARSTVTVNVSPIPATPQADEVAVCAGNPAELVVRNIEVHLKYKWYTTATGGTPVYIGSAFRTAALTSSTTYFVAAETAEGCISASRQPVAVNVSQVPAVPVVAGLTICAGSGTTLTVTSPDASLIYNWYNDAGNILASGTSFITGNLSSTTTYYVEASSRTVPGCTSSRRAVTVTVTPLPAEAEVADVTICAGATATLVVSNAAPSVNYNWYDASETLLATGTSFTTPALQASTTFYVEAVTTNGCMSATRQAAVVNVTPSISNNLINADQTICYGSTAAALNGLQPMGGGGGYSYQWEKSWDGTNFTSIAGATSPAYAPGILTTNTWLRRIVTAAGPCRASISNTVVITVTPLPAAPVAQSTSVCAGATATLSVRDPNSNLTYRWYSTATEGAILHTGVMYSVELQSSATFYVEAVTSGGCMSPRRAVTVPVTPVPEAPVVTDKTVCLGQQAVLAVSAPDPALIYRWYDSNNDLMATGATYTTEGLAASATYFVEAATTGTMVCTSSRSALRVFVSPLPATPVVNDAIVCSGGAAGLTIQVIDPALTYKWYTTAAGGTAVATGTTFHTGALTSPRTYYVEAVTASGCASDRANVQVAVTPLPATPVAGNVAICAGAVATLAVTNPEAELVYRWYDAASDGNLLTTGETFTTPSVVASTTYYLEAATANGCASAVRRAVTVQVTPLPAAPEADNVTICSGTSATLWVKNPAPDLVYNWYSGGALAGTGVSYTTGNLSASTTYAVEAVTNSGPACASSARRTVYVTVTPAIANNFITANQTICSGTIPARLTGSVPNGGGGGYSYQWERSEDGINFTAIATATNADYSPNALNVTTWFRRKVKAQGTCGESISPAVEITITALPAMPVADNVSICAGATATLNIKDVKPAYTYRWYTAPTGGSAVLAGTSFTTNALESSVTFYVEAVNADGCVSPRRAVTVSVLALPDAPLAADQDICVGEQATLTVSNQAANLTYRWYSGNGTLLATGTTYITEALNSNTVYYVEAATAATPQCVSGRSAVAVNVAARPATPLADDVTICAGSPATLAVKGIIPGLTYKWYTVATGGLPVHTGSAYTTATLTSGRTYYLEAATASGCTSSSRKAVVVTVIQPPVSPVAADRTICFGQPVTLSVTNPDANLRYHWYDQHGNALATGNSYTTRELSAGATFYVEAVTNASSPGCASPRDAVVVTVTPLPATPEVENATVCAGTTASLSVSNTAPSVTYKWYSENGELQGTGAVFTTPALSVGTSYLVEAVTANGCANATPKTVTVQVMQPITSNVIGAAQTICSGSAPARLTGSHPNGGNGTYSFQWESSEDGINFRSIANAFGREYTPGNLSVTTWFRRKAAAGNSCPANTSEAVKITVVPIPAMPLAGEVIVCAGEHATLRIDSPNDNLTYHWYEAATGGSTLAIGKTFVATSVVTTTTYFVEAVNASGCTSSRRAVPVYVMPIPEAPEAEDEVICAGSFATLKVTRPGTQLVYNWYDSNGILQRTGSSFTTPALDRTTVYYVEATTATPQACKGPRKAVTVRVTPTPATPVVDQVSVCAGSTAILAVKNYDAALTYRWYSAAKGGTPLANGPSYTTTSLTTTRTYYAEARTATGCISDRQAVTVTVTPRPALPEVTGKVICAGQATTLAVKEADAELSYRWYDASVGGTLLATGSTFATGTLSQSRTYYVEAETSLGCVSASRKAVGVSVRPLPAVPAVEDATICAGDKVTLFVKNPDPTLQYKWYGDAAATNLIGSGISYTSSQALFAGRSFFVEAVNASSCTSAALQQVEVLVIGKPNAPVVEEATVCAGSRATLAVEGPDASLVYRWQDANGTLLHTGTTYTTAPVSSDATFYVTAFTTTQPACASNRQAVRVRVMAALTANTISGNQSICSGQAPAKLRGSLPAGGGAALTYQWERSEDGINYVDIVGAHAQEYVPGNLTTTTWFRRKVKAAGPCSERVSNAVRITVTALPETPQAVEVRICAGSPAFLLVKYPFSSKDNITYRWYQTASGGSPLGSGISFTTPDLTASTAYYLEAVNENGCTSSRLEVPVTVYQPVTNNTISSNQTICIGSQPAGFDGSIADAGTATVSYQWEVSTDGLAYKDIAGATGQHYFPAAALTKTTWYRRKVLTDGPCEEHLSNAVKIEVIPQPIAPTVSQAAICPGSRVTLEAKAMAGLTVEWYDAPQGGNLLFIGSSYQTPVLNTTTSFWAQTVNSNNCESAVRQEAKVLAVGPQVTVSDASTILEGKPVQLLATGGTSYHWQPETGLSDPQAANPVARPAETTTYTVTITTKEGCSVVKQVTITVQSRIIIANVLTPNGDGFNDNFEIKNIEHYPDCQVEIYTRWGEKVFESKGYKEAWNGTKNGNALPTAAYYYIIRLNKNDKPISGSVTIVK